MNFTSLGKILFTPRWRDHGAGGGTGTAAAVALLQPTKILRCGTAGPQPAVIVEVQLVGQGALQRVALQGQGAVVAPSPTGGRVVITRTTASCHLLRDIELRESSGGQPYWDMRERVNEEGRMYLDDGWAGFADWYQLRSGHVLKFRYRGSSQFVVKIFDKSMCCRSYWPYFLADGASDGSQL
ncbi:hypothetical protein QYE76_058690 [Lolium multiflorum]|uniref:TF-B3 domain-containing protein n=1 Tax=Lolium multiflorum TaxID=4521 RepID=A0AAD8T5X5_LOLMU|nr:hypothetical protein QYE76_058690 [Lolium multiflorum]